jgi:FKBP-type peptidyl-prolyl cis-trans isomerase
MKQSSRISIVLLMLIISFSACKEDIYVDWKIKNEQWLENNLSKPGVIPTASGLQYKVVYQGDPYGRYPKPSSLIYVTYNGTLIDGSSFDNQTNAGMYLSQTIKGWQEGIRKMQTGGVYELYVPSELAYDTISTNAKIPPHSILIFKIELLSSNY